VANEEFKRFIKKFGQLKVFTEDQVSRIMAKNKDNIEDANVDQMYEDGENVGGASLGEYTLFTKIQKRKKGQKTDHITLRDTGAFHKSIKLKANSKLRYDLIATDLKKEKLEKRFGKLTGLNEENLNRLRNILIRELKTSIDQFLKA